MLLDADPLVVVVSREEVNAGDTSGTLRVLHRLIESPMQARSYFERVDIAFHGYDGWAQEPFEIIEVRSFVTRLDEKFPYWLFFLSKRYLGLQCLLHCFLPPFLTEEGRARVFPQRIHDLLMRRWIPAMNHMCAFAGLSDEEGDALTERAVEYITRGPLRTNA
jgi:hypothetical protein